MQLEKTNTDAFKAAYRALNKSQQRAVDAIAGPVLVVAGPGTGKTQVLTLRIANILLQTDTPPDGILALTFTESGAKAMRQRLLTYVGPTAYRVPIYTFHAFAQLLITEYPDAYERVVGGRPASEIEKIDLIQDILDTGRYSLLRPISHPAYYVLPVLKIISQLKQENVTPNRFVSIINEQQDTLDNTEQYHAKGAHKGKVRSAYADLEKRINKNLELAEVYRQYDAVLGQSHLYDFDDMILETVHALQTNEDMLRDLQERFLYIVADEHQDVNGAQNKILELLTSFDQSPNLFVVGDEKQAIYRFQGASLDNFLYFKEQFPHTTTIELTENYRSGQTILDAAHDLVAVEAGPLKALRIPLTAAAVTDATVTRRCFSHQAIEDDWLVSEVQALLTEGVKESEIAVIVRTNREVEAITANLRRKQIAVSASAEGDILQHAATRSIQDLIRVVTAMHDQAALVRVLHGTYWGISATGLLRILTARTGEKNLWDVLTDQAVLAELTADDRERVKNVYTTIETARAQTVSLAPHRVLENLLHNSGLLDYLIAVDPFESTRVVRRVYDEVETLVTRDGVSDLEAINTLFETYLRHRLPLNAPYIEDGTESVQVMTAHKSKGLEFSVVFIPHLTDAAWGGATRRQLFKIPLTKHADDTTDERLEDDRRLLYVAMTRAKHTLYISSSDTNADGKELVPSRLLADIEPTLLPTGSTKDAEASFSPLTTLQGSLVSKSVDTDLLRHLVEQRGFSATSINNYLRSPWEYFYNNILRIPKVQPAHMLYGTAVHNTLEFLTTSCVHSGEVPGATQIKSTLERELNQLPLTTEEFAQLLEKGMSEIVVYREHLAKTLPRHTKAELSISVQLQTGIPELPEIPLSGKLDRVDFDEAGRIVRVVDYKTGKPKSRNVIIGATKNSDGGYKRQLVFYALLLKLYGDDRYQSTNGTLSFVQADAKGNIREESFQTTEEEIEELTATIIAATRHMISGAFMSEPCDEQVSEYCHLARRFLE